MEVFGASKSHTTAYHPQGNGMMKWFNHTLLQMLHSYVDAKENWQELPFMLTVLQCIRQLGHLPLSQCTEGPPRLLNLRRIVHFPLVPIRHILIK